jgi:hypothetical protein
VSFTETKTLASRCTEITNVKAFNYWPWEELFKSLPWLSNEPLTFLFVFSQFIVKQRVSTPQWSKKCKEANLFEA